MWPWRIKDKEETPGGLNRGLGQVNVFQTAEQSLVNKYSTPRTEGLPNACLTEFHNFYASMIVLGLLYPCSIILYYIWGITCFLLNSFPDPKKRYPDLMRKTTHILEVLDLEPEAVFVWIFESSPLGVQYALCVREGVDHSRSTKDHAPFPLGRVVIESSGPTRDSISQHSFPLGGAKWLICTNGMWAKWSVSLSPRSS